MGQPVKFYMDEHTARSVVRALRQLGADVRTVKEAGLLGATDEEHLERANTEGRALFTQDDDFFALCTRPGSSTPELRMHRRALRFGRSFPALR